MPRAARDRHAAANIGARLRLERFPVKPHNPRHEDDAMSDNPTREIPDSRSFEERVFARFDALDARMDRLDSRMDGLDGRMDRVESRLGSLETKFDGLDGRLNSLEEKVDTRLRETRPVWEGVLTRLDGIESELARLNRQFRSFVADIFQLRARVEKLEEDNDKRTA